MPIELLAKHSRMPASGNLQNRRFAGGPIVRSDHRRRAPALRLLCAALVGCAGWLWPMGCVGALGAGPRQAPEFQADWTSVPRSFRGDDVTALTRALGVERSEFEPVAAYAEKVKAIAQKKERYVFLVDPGQGGLPNFGVRYDPGRELFDIRITVGWDSAMLLAVDESSRYAFSSRNAFGTGTKVVDMAVEKYSIRLTNESISVVTPTDKVIYEGTMKSPLAEAPGTKGRIRFLVVAEIVPGTGGAERAYTKSLEGNPYYGREFYLSDATAAQPVNLNEYQHFLHARLDSVWVYDGPTGAVLKKYSPAEGDEAVRQARQALAEGKYYTAQALISKLPDDNPVARKVRADIEAMRLENADDEIARMAEGKRTERLRVHGPEPDPLVARRFIQRLVPVLIEGPSEIVASAPPVRALATIGGELRAVWQVRVEVRNKKDQTMSHLYVYIKYDEIVGYDLI